MPSPPGPRCGRRSAAARRPLIYATIIAALAIVPVAVLQGRPGAFFTPMVLAYVLAVAAAMVVALTVAPALTSLFFAGGRGLLQCPADRWPAATTVRSAASPVDRCGRLCW